jgi:hypothetical protein
MPALEESRVGHELDSKLLATVCKMAVRVVRLTVGYAAARRLAICGMLWAGPVINMCLQDSTDRSRNTPQSHSFSHAPYREAQTPRQLWYLHTLFDGQHISASWCLHSISCISTTIKTLTVMCGSLSVTPVLHVDCVLRGLASLHCVSACLSSAKHQRPLGWGV